MKIALFWDEKLKPRLEKAWNTRAGKFALVSLFVFVGLFFLVIIKGFCHISFVRLPSLATQAEGISIYDYKDQLVTIVQQEGEREPVPLSAISPNVRNALIAVEDRNFYHHFGVDPFGIIRAVFTNMKEGELQQGGSTLTQQLMKTKYFGFQDKSMRRKILEIFMAIDVENGYSKDKILETYLNEVYFGRGAYGIERAARIYFDKSALNLSIPEAAFLAGLIKAPSSYGTNADKALKRQKEVLRDMSECGYIKPEELTVMQNIKLNFKAGPRKLKFPFYTLHAVDIVKKELGENEIWKHPIKIYTYLDQQAQAEAEAALWAGVRKAPKGVNQGALVSMNIKDGSVFAMVGAANYEQNQWNRALNPHTTGSSFKPFVYLTGLITGTLNADSVIVDEPLTLPDGKGGGTYTPKNYDNTYMGPLNVRDALKFSRNVCAVKVAVDAGPQNIAQTAMKAGITAQMEPTPSLALGTAAVTPMEMATAYATIARGGYFMAPIFVRKIVDKDNHTMREFKTVSKQVLPQEPCLQIIDAMVDVVKEGTGKRAYLTGVEVAGKTGTSDEQKDLWFVGMTPEVVTAVWTGNDANDAVHARAATGGVVPAAIWANYMRKYYLKHPKRKVAFTDPKVALNPGMPDSYEFLRAIDETVEDVGQAVDENVTKPVKSIVGKTKGMFKRFSEAMEKLF